MSIIKAKEKSNKIHENIIGKIIYGFLLFAPLLMILTTSCYAIFNKNAHESYYGETVNQWQDHAIESYKTDTKYYFSYNGSDLLSTNTSLPITIVNLTAVPNNDINVLNQNAADIVSIYFFQNSGRQYIAFRDSNNTTIGNNAPLQNNLLSFEYNYVALSNNDNVNNWLKNNSYYRDYNKYSYLDNNFEYGINKTEESEYFNWSKSTALYTGLRATCQSLGIDNTFTPMLMAYWLLISIIYFIFDIGLIMVHLVHRKIHEFTESV